MAPTPSVLGYSPDAGPPQGTPGVVAATATTLSRARPPLLKATADRAQCEGNSPRRWLPRPRLREPTCVLAGGRVSEKVVVDQTTVLGRGTDSGRLTYRAWARASATGRPMLARAPATRVSDNGIKQGVRAGVVGLFSVSARIWDQ